MSLVSSSKLIDSDVVYLGCPFIVLSNDVTIQTNGLDYLNYFDLISIIQLEYPELNFSFLNSIGSGIDEDFIFKNSLTESIEFEEDISNELLSYNEIEQNFIIQNTLEQDLNENYNGFYFNKLHGV